MTTYYRATFSDGTVVKRATASRKYSHAWLARLKNQYLPEKYGPTRDLFGFCGSIVLAHNTIGRFVGAERTVLAEVAPAIEITRKEYKS